MCSCPYAGECSGRGPVRLHLYGRCAHTREWKLQESTKSLCDASSDVQRTGCGVAAAISRGWTATNAIFSEVLRTVLYGRYENLSWCISWSGGGNLDVQRRVDSGKPRAMMCPIMFKLQSIAQAGPAVWRPAAPAMSHEAEWENTFLDECPYSSVLQIRVAFASSSSVKQHLRESSVAFKFAFSSMRKAPSEYLFD
ncbi:hypothetical protein BDV96DRAFT_300716 [Lophiotrema nucula]|uniref:Uncharacterized protein n=1 Tax=Lophiotrema nucula TaxID=690887 RepID=A0A6A5YMH9_9PLEO|nr:hypothetical protein BDV96DRAFT_300716 [Lophiotrema nucula]